MQVKVKRLHCMAELPKRATDGAACFDIAADDDGADHPRDSWALIYSTGLAFEIPPGHVC